MTVSPLDAPRPLPGVPCLTYGGHRVKREPWAPCPRMTHVEPGCDLCAFPGPLAATHGMIEPNPGETWECDDEQRLPSGRVYIRSRKRSRPAHAYIGLVATLCPQCYDLTVLDTKDSSELAPIASLLCDGCDAHCALGVDHAEARSNLKDMGGWSGGDADWDLCPSCNPATNPSVPPRALAAFREAGNRVPR